ncbi:MAG: iron-sulfur cluster assembly protein [Bacteroidota bacterium]
MDNTEMMMLEQAVIDKVKEVYDPEIPVNIYDLGMVYEISIAENKTVSIKMTLTSPNCPMAEEIPGMVRDAVLAVEGITEVIIDLTFDPPWDPSMMSPVAKLELGML